MSGHQRRQPTSAAQLQRVETSRIGPVDEVNVLIIVVATRTLYYLECPYAPSAFAI